MFDFDEFDKLFRGMHGSFVNLDDLLDAARHAGAGGGSGRIGPYYYGYTMTVGPDGRPVVREYGNVRPGLAGGDAGAGAGAPALRDGLQAETIVDDKERVLKLVAEMPGVEKEDVKIVVDGDAVSIDADRGKKSYHAKVPLDQKVDRGTAKATYRNGILELAFRLADPDPPKGTTVEVR